MQNIHVVNWESFIFYDVYDAISGPGNNRHYISSLNLYSYKDKEECGIWKERYRGSKTQSNMHFPAKRRFCHLST